MKKYTLFTLIFICSLLFSSWTTAAAATGEQASAVSTRAAAPVATDAMVSSASSVTASAAVQAAASSGKTLTITNPLPKATTVTLSGAGDYTIVVSANQTKTKTIPQGSYRYKYLGCLDKTYSGILKYKDGSYTLDIPACKMVTVRIINPFFETYTSTMSGWMNYNITVKPRHIESFEVVAGVYYLKYTCTPSNKGWEGKVRLKKNITWVMCD